MTAEEKTSDAVNMSQLHVAKLKRAEEITLDALSKFEKASSCLVSACGLIPLRRGAARNFC
jgi:hypothetical protein